MNSFIIYSLSVGGIQLLFLFVYQFVFSKETFFNVNRFFLLGSLLFSFVIPFIPITFYDSGENTFVQLNRIVISLQEPNVNSNIFEKNNFLKLADVFTLVYFIIVLALIVLMCMRLIYLRKIINSSVPQNVEGITIFRKKDSLEAFSFFNYIVIGEGHKDIGVILYHELVHIKRKHSIDLLLIEVIKIIFWFNPFIYIYHNFLEEIHEYEADAYSLKRDKKKYYESLISQIFQLDKVALTNTFFNQSLIKKRIVMLQKSKSKSVSLFKYLLIVPIVFLGVFLFSNCQNDPSVIEIHQERNDQNNKIFSFKDAVPRFIECENTPNEEALECFNKQMQEHIMANFTYPTEMVEKNVEGMVVVEFVIEKDGSVSTFKTKGPKNGKLLEEEAERILSLLPKLVPGKIDGKPVRVKFGLPITFKLE